MFLMLIVRSHIYNVPSLARGRRYIALPSESAGVRAYAIGTRGQAKQG